MGDTFRPASGCYFAVVEQPAVVDCLRGTWFLVNGGSNALTFSAAADKNGTNATVAYAWEDPHKILSNTTVAYRCVPDTRKRAAPGLARL